jgi:hypothetical protein
MFRLVEILMSATQAVKQCQSYCMTLQGCQICTPRRAVLPLLFPVVVPELKTDAPPFNHWGTKDGSSLSIGYCTALHSGSYAVSQTASSQDVQILRFSADSDDSSEANVLQQTQTG